MRERDGIESSNLRAMMSLPCAWKPPEDLTNLGNLCTDVCGDDIEFCVWILVDFSSCDTVLFVRGLRDRRMRWHGR